MNGISNNNNLLAILGGQQNASASPFGVGNSAEGLNPEEFMSLLQDASNSDPGMIDEFMAKALKSDPAAREAFAKALGKEDASLALEFEVRKQKVLAENPQLQTLLKGAQEGITPDPETLEEFAKNPELNQNIKDIMVGQKKNSSAANVSGSKLNAAEAEIIEGNPRIPLDLQMGKGPKVAGQNNGMLQLGGKQVKTTGSDFVSQLNTTTSPELMQAAQGNADVLPFETRAKNANNLLNKIKGYGKNQDIARKTMFDINPADFNSKISLSDDLGNSFEVEAASGEKGESSFDFMSSSMKSSGLDSSSVVGPNTKVVDLSNIQASNKSELITKITNYIEMNKLENSNHIDVLVKHDELGDFRVNAKKAGPGNQVDLQIQAASKEAQVFFAENEVDIIKNLDKSGIKLSQFKIVTANTKSEMMSFSSDSRNSGSNFSEGSQVQSQSQGMFGRSESSEQRDSQRRKELWEQYKEQSQAFA